MKKNFSLDFKKLDILIILISLLISSFLLVFVLIKNNSSQGSRYLQVMHHNKIIESCSINLDEVNETTVLTLKQADYNDLLGDFYIEINPDKGIRVIDITCPNKNCEHQGYINMLNFPIVCLPNDIVIQIISKTGSGADTTLGCIYYEDHSH